MPMTRTERLLDNIQHLSEFDDMTDEEWSAWATAEFSVWTETAL